MNSKAFNTHINFTFMQKPKVSNLGQFDVNVS